MAVELFLVRRTRDPPRRNERRRGGAKDRPLLRDCTETKLRSRDVLPLDSPSPRPYNGHNNLTGNREEILRGRGTPKVQTWNRRNQVKLSGKRTLSRTNSGK